MKKYTLPALIMPSFEKFKDKASLSFVGEEPLTYTKLGEEVRQLAGSMISLGVSKNDKVAILSANMPNWGIAYFATSFLGAVNVPILPDFHSKEIENIISHSESKVLFVSRRLISKLKDIEMPSLETVILIDTLEIVEDYKAKKSTLSPMPTGVYEEKMADQIHEDDLAAIIYTSGTTGSSKGVMLTHKNLTSNVEQCDAMFPIYPEDRFLSLLPLSHAYENTLGLLFPVSYGCSVNYLKQLPTPSVLLPALKRVKPTIILSVPLIIEKIYKKNIVAKFSKKKITHFLYEQRPTRKLIHAFVGNKIKEVFGGELRFFGIGGAKLDTSTEEFLRDINFPYAIGYGLTETSPLLAGSTPSTSVYQGAGPKALGCELELHNVNPATGEGELWAKGPNIMKGYFKEPNLTKDILTEDGWFKTGDLVSVDKKGNVFIKGRIKNVLLGSSGENIYPEEIESIINNFKFVLESVVVLKKGKLVAMVHFNREELEARYKKALSQAEDFVDEKLEELMEELQAYVNSRVNRFSQLQMVLLQHTPFEKTPTHKIKRFLYA